MPCVFPAGLLVDIKRISSGPANLLSSLTLCCRTPKCKLRRAVVSEEVEILRYLSNHGPQKIHQQAVHVGEQERERDLCSMLSHWSLAVPMCHRPSDYKQGFSWASTSSTPRKPLEVPFEDLQDPKFNRGLPRRLICEWPRKSFLAVIKANPREAIFDWNMWMDQSFFSAENTACDSKIVSDIPQTQRSFPKRRPFVISTSGKKNIHNPLPPGSKPASLFCSCKDFLRVPWCLCGLWAFSPNDYTPKHNTKHA